MHKSDIKAAIEKKGATLSTIDRINGFPIGTCRDSLRRKRPRAEFAICEFIGLPPHIVFPNRYDVAGNRIDLRKKSTNVESISKSQPSRQLKNHKMSRNTGRCPQTSSQGGRNEA